MPLPTPKKSEKKSDFIGRCVSSKVMQTEYPDKKQRLAVCYSQWNRKNKKTDEGGGEYMGMKSKKVPKASLRLLSGGADACALSDKDGKVRLQMTVYSGKIIPNHWYWGNLSIDLQGGVFSQSKYPILEDHMTSKKIAFSGKPVIGEDIQLNPDTTEFVDTKESAEFQRLSAQGFPYQASIYATPLSVEWVKPGASVDVNGYKLKGPGAVWRKWKYNEASVCVFGADSKTNSKVFSKQDLAEIQMSEKGSREEVMLTQEKLEVDADIVNDKKEVTKKMEMTVEKFKEEYPDVYKEILKMAKGKDSSEDAKKFSELVSTVEGLTEKVKKLSEENKDIQKENTSLKKEVEISKEKAMKADAEKKFDEILSEKEVPDRFHSKIKSQVSYNEFVDSETGKLDMEKFTEAVKAEVDSWSELFTDIVQGGGTLSRSTDDTEAKRLKEQKENDNKLTNNLLNMVGYAIDEK